MATINRVFADRREAGAELARTVAKRRLQPPMLVSGLPRGGVPVAREVAQAPQAPLDVMFDPLAQREHAEIERREPSYRAGLPPLDLKGRTAVLVDDGLATGSTMLAAVRAARKAGAASVVVAP